MRKTEDREIVDLFLKRDELAISYTANKYGKRLRQLAIEILGDFQLAEECENEVYQKTWESIPPNMPYDYLYAYLVRLNRNTALNICRRMNSLKRSARIEELTVELTEVIPSDDTVESAIDDILLKEKLNSFLATLSEEKRNIFIRRYWYMDSVSQIAEGYRISNSKVKVILFRLRNKLKKYLESEGYTL